MSQLLKLPLPLPSEISSLRANCFNAVQIYFSDTAEIGFMGPEPFVHYIQNNFKQVQDQRCEDVLIIWSRDESKPESGNIDISKLNKSNPGYPFGLIIEHALIITENGQAFQKRGLTENCPYEIVSIDEAMNPYKMKFGLEITRHRYSRPTNIKSAQAVSD